MITYKLSGLLCDATSSLENVFDIVDVINTQTVVSEDSGPVRDILRVYCRDSANMSAER